MCEICMVYGWKKDSGEYIDQLCRCINGNVNHFAEGESVKDGFIIRFNNRNAAIAWGWEYGGNNEWLCPSCAAAVRQEGK